MSVLQLVASANQETVDALAYLLYEAQHGDVSGLNITFRRPGGDVEALSTGADRARPELALMAIMRFSMILTRASGEFVDPP